MMCGRQDIDDARRDIYVYQRRIIFNWRLLKENIQPIEIIDVLISHEFVENDLWDSIKNDSRRSQMNSILTHVVRNIQTSEKFEKFKAIVARVNNRIELKTPSFDSSPVDSKNFHSFSLVNRFVL